MITLKEANAQSVQLQTKLQELKGEFIAQATAMRDVALQMESGAPPGIRFLSVTEALQTAFENRCQEVLDFCETCAAGENKKPSGEANSLEDLQRWMESALESLWQQERESALTPLRKAMAATRRGGAFVSHLEAFKQQARELLERLEACDADRFESEVLRVQNMLKAFSAMIDLIEQGESLDDEQCEKLRQTAVEVFDSTLVIAALRGHISFEKGAATPELPTLTSTTSKKEKKASVSQAKSQKKEEVKTERVEEPIAPSGSFEWTEGNGWGRIPSDPSKEKTPAIIQPPQSWSDRVILLEREFEKVHFHEIIMGMIGRRQVSSVLDFRHLPKEIAESTVQSLQDWVAMTRDLKATSHEVESVLRGCGFEILDVKPENRHRISFTVTCQPILSGINLPPGYVTSSSNGRFRIACYWGRPSEDMLLSEISDDPEEDAVIIFHFGMLTDERRLDLAKLCKANRQHLIVLDDITLVYLFSLEEGRLATFFANALPNSYEDRLAQERHPLTGKVLPV
ncbi:MAG: hypothetical protein ACOY3I_01825 [Verrucomicrobiota bacterium]